MRLDRNTTIDHSGKYAVVRLRKLREFMDGPSSDEAKYAASDCLLLLEDLGILTYGSVHTPNEFFVIMLKDRYADEALDAYADAAREDGNTEYADEIDTLAERSGRANPFCKRPD